MLFNSFAYAVFLPVVFILYWLIPQKYRWILLLIASCFFYMCWNPGYIALIAFTTLVSFSCGLLLERTRKKRMKKACVTGALLMCLGVLFVFKYYNFAADTVSRVFPSSGIKRLRLLLPVGISFYTFQTVSYVVDVYRGTVPAEKHLGRYAAFVSFFPQLVAGPIERAGDLLPQIRESRGFRAGDCYYGFFLIAAGLFKKVLIADNLAVYVDLVYGDIFRYKGCSILLATVFFSLQIYCDFSGYSDIARGSAKLLGIDLTENFKSPYLSTCVKEFWNRWHISLSNWFRDYLYIPMGGNRRSKFRTCMNLMVTFLVSGLWHGASWNFVVWGGIHGAAQIFENALGIKKADESPRYSVLAWLRRIALFCFLVFSWAFFRASNVGEGLYAVRSAFSGITQIRAYFAAGFSDLGLQASSIPLFLLYIVPLSVYDFCSLKTDPIRWIRSQKKWFQYAAMAVLILLILLYGYAGQTTFVYFQF